MTLCLCGHNRGIHISAYDGDHCEIVTHPCVAAVWDREGKVTYCDCVDLEVFRSVIKEVEDA